MFKVERPITLLFDLLRLQSQGNLPSNMAEDIVPTMDLGLLSLAESGTDVLYVPSVGATATSAVGIVGTRTLTRPFKLQQAAVSWSAAQPGDNLELDLLYSRTAASEQITLASAQATGLALNVGQTRTAVTQPDLWLPTGAVLTLVCWHIAVGGVGIPNSWAQIVGYQPQR